MNKKIDLEFYKKLAVIALPIAFQSLISSSLTLLDNLMVSSLGELSLSAVGVAAQIFSIEWMVIFGFCTGSSTFFTQLWGLKDLKRIRKVVGIATITCALIGAIFCTLALTIPVQILSLFTNSFEVAALGAVYLRTTAINFILVGIIQPFSAALRSTQQTKIPMLISIASFTTDALFNYLLIFGKFGFPMLGVQGAAIATVIARCVELILTLFVVFVKKNIIAGKIKEFLDFDFTFVKRVFANASYACLNETAWGTAFVATNACYGHLGVTAYAAVQASATIMDLFQLACFSIGDGAIILIGEQIGKGNIEEGKKISRKAIKASLVLGCFMALILIISSKSIIRLFNLTELGRFYAVRLIIIRAIFLPINLQNALIIAGIFRAGGDAGFAAKLESLTMWLLAVPIAALGVFVFELPVYMVLFLSSLEGVFKLILVYKRYFSDKWIKNMITGM